MPALKDVTVLTKNIDDLAGQLHAELTEGGIDFEQMVRLADEISSSADRLAASFNTMAKALAESLDVQEGSNGSDANGSRAAGAS
jgi:chemotaxis regulatin CheY-phosphate phosphatase CheZ